MSENGRKSDPRSLIDTERDLTLLGLQALLIGRSSEDRQALLKPVLGAKDLRPAQERGFFHVRARYGKALDRYQTQLARAGRQHTGRREAPSIAAAIGSRLAGLQIVGPDDPGTPIDTSFDPGEGPATDTSQEDLPTRDLAFEEYPRDVQQAAQTYFDVNTSPLLNEQQRKIVDQVNGYVAAGGAAGGAPKFEGGGFAGGFINDHGDLDIGKINDALTVIAVGASLGIGGVAGAALGALAYIMVPRMLAAIENEIGDLIVGSLPGF
jgi:hypothetical protein